MIEDDDPWDPPERAQVTPKRLSETIDRLTLRQKAYLGIPDDVLTDLRGFCRADRTCFDPDARIHAVMEGRREVWLRIQQHIELTAEELLALYSSGQLSHEMLKGTEYDRG